MKNNLIKLLTENKEVRLYIVDATDILRHSNLKDMKTDFAKQLYEKIFTNCCLLRGFLTEESQRINVIIRFKPKGCYVRCDVDGSGNINCVLSSPLREFHGNLKDLLGEGSTISITRGSWMGGMFTGTVELSSHSVDHCFSNFYSKSEQIETIFRTRTENGFVRGCMIQPLPFAHNDSLKYIIKNINEVNLASSEWGQLPEKVFPDAKVIEKYTLKTECNCSREMFFGMLMSVDTDELKQSIGINKSEELECGICGKKYVFNKEDLEAIVKIKDGG